MFGELWDFLEAKAKTFGDAMSAIGAAVRAALEAMFGPVIDIIDKAKAAAEWLRSNLGGAGGEGATSDPAAQEQQRRNFQNRMQGLYPEPGVTVAPARRQRRVRRRGTRRRTMTWTSRWRSI